MTFLRVKISKLFKSASLKFGGTQTPIPVSKLPDTAPPPITKPETPGESHNREAFVRRQR